MGVRNNKPIRKPGAWPAPDRVSLGGRRRPRGSVPIDGGSDDQGEYTARIGPGPAAIAIALVQMAMGVRAGPRDTPAAAARASQVAGARRTHPASRAGRSPSRRLLRITGVERARWPYPPPKGTSQRWLEASEARKDQMRDRWGKSDDSPPAGRRARPHRTPLTGKTPTPSTAPGQADYRGPGHASVALWTLIGTRDQSERNSACRHVPRSRGPDRSRRISPTYAVTLGERGLNRSL